MIQKNTMVKLKVIIIAWYFNFASFLAFELKIMNSKGICFWKWQTWYEL